MKQSVFLKIIAIVLSALALTGVVLSGLCMITAEQHDLYSRNAPSLEERWLDQNIHTLQYYLLQQYIQQNLGEQGNVYLNQVLENYQVHNDLSFLEAGVDYEYTIRNMENDKLERSTRTAAIPVSTFNSVCQVEYYRTESAQDTLEDTWIVEDYYDTVHNNQRIIYGTNSDPYEVTIYLLSPAMAKISPKVAGSCLSWLYQQRNHLIVAFIICLLLWAVSACYLVAAVNHKAGTQTLQANGLNRLPLDFYGAICFFFVCLFIAIAVDIVYFPYYLADLEAFRLLVVLFLLLLCALLVIGWCLAVAAQLKQGHGFWWRNSVTGRILLWGIRWCRWIAKKAWLCWELVPIMWHWLASGAAILLGMLLFITAHNGFFLFLLILAAGGLIVYNGIGFGLLLQGVRRMSQGNLEEKVIMGQFAGQYRIFAEHLNSMADAAMQVARKQAASERMKSELITNVSHDIKTPLTSIVNYVDLLQKPHTPQEGERYLEVLSRQSQRMKKLVEDLVEMSKASTGNLTVELIQMDAAEALHQALGEFAEKLERVPLEVIVQGAQEPVLITADGRLVWRVLSNILGNAVKYAMPGTRFYIHLQQTGNWVTLSLKNISKDSLNISAEELMERFVRGDASRNTEGSGLGLNIAQSLMELQHGSLELVVDGDLFKVTLSFPAGK